MTLLRLAAVRGQSIRSVLSTGKRVLMLKSRKSRQTKLLKTLAVFRISSEAAPIRAMKKPATAV